jgi:hypothetical protein
LTVTIDNETISALCALLRLFLGLASSIPRPRDYILFTNSRLH